MVDIKNNLQQVRAEIAKAIERRRPDLNEEVKLIAVTKNHTIDEMRYAIDNGVDNIGENRIQEASKKFSTLDRKVTKHLIGHLQTNKVKSAVQMFDLIHSVDSEHLAIAINNTAQSINKIQNILIQVNLANEETKTGIEYENLNELINLIKELKNLKLEGLMMIAPNFDDVENCRPLFKHMYQIFSELKNQNANVKYLSMGMSHDYKIAIEEGANMIRVGTAIFGARNYNL